VGLTVETLEILAWHKRLGEQVSQGEAIADLAADKADVEIEAPGDGVLAEIIAEVGAQVPPGAAIGRIGGTEDGPEPYAERAPAERAASEPVSTPTSVAGDRGTPAVTPLARRAAAALGVHLAAVNGTGPGGRVTKQDVERAASPEHRGSSPAARRLAAELGVPVGEATGTGPGGRIVEADVQRAAAASSPAAPTRTPGPGDIAPAPAGAAVRDAIPVRWTAARRLTARRMAESAATVVPVTLHRRADASAALAAAAELKRAGVAATFTHVLLACTAAALRDHPELNAVWDGETLLRCQSVDIGLAVDAEAGLFVPVIRDADKLDVTALAQIAGGLVASCRAGVLRSEDLSGSSFSVSNLGMLGVEQFTPVVNPPHVAVLGVGAITREAVPAEGGLMFERWCHLSLTFDHRAVDGAPAARFLGTVARRLAEA
jgi:pyruvate dehydrogenase E2 component (dihydrolipoamide acetyltransferase)